MTQATLSRPRSPHSTLLLLLALLSGSGLLSCSRDVTEAHAQEAPPAPVGTLTAVLSAQPVLKELPGRVAPTRVAEVRPRVSGIILERRFEQGSDVKEGDVLFRLDSAALRADQAAARAALLRAQSAEKNAQREAERAEKLLEGGVLTELERDQRTTAYSLAQADVQVARASLERATVLLDYTTIRAPISGRIGRALITEGALVGPESATPLALIQQVDPVYVDFTQSATELSQLRRAIRAGAVGAVEKESTPVQLLFSDGSPYAHTGELLFSDLSVDPNSGRVTLRGSFPNPEGDLLPGMYVRVRIEQATRAEALVLPDQAIRRDTGRPSPVVYVVGEGNRVEVREVQVTEGSRPNETIVESGLQAGEVVIVDGFQKFGPGSLVAPTPWASAGAPAP